MNALRIAQLYMNRMLSNKRAWWMTFVLPTGLVLFMMMTTMTKVAPVVVWFDADQSIWSKELHAQMAQRFEIIQADTPEEVRQSADHSGQGIYIPDSYSESLMKGALPQVDMYYNDRNEQSALVQLTLEQSVQEQARLWLSMGSFQQGERTSNSDVEAVYTAFKQSRPVLTLGTDNGEAPISQRIAMGIFMMFIFMNALQAVSVMIEDRHNRTMLRTYAAPVRSSEISLGYFLGAFWNGTIQIAIVLGIVHLLLGSRMSIHFLEQFLMLELYLLAILGCLCMLSAVLIDMKRFAQVGFAIIVPTCMLGGCFWPVYIMAPYMQQISYFVPQRWVLDAMDKLEAGASFDMILLPIGVLLLFAVIFLGVGVSALRPSARES